MLFGKFGPTSGKRRLICLKLDASVANGLISESHLPAS